MEDPTKSESVEKPPKVKRPRTEAQKAQFQKCIEARKRALEIAKRDVSSEKPSISSKKRKCSDPSDQSEDSKLPKTPKSSPKKSSIKKSSVPVRSPIEATSDVIEEPTKEVSKTSKTSKRSKSRKQEKPKKVIYAPVYSDESSDGDISSDDESVSAKQNVIRYVHQTQSQYNPRKETSRLSGPNFVYL